MIGVSAFCLLFCIVMLLCRILFKSSDLFNKVLIMNIISTQIILLITIISIVTSNFFVLDIALLYASISFISTIAFMKFMLIK
ncbi:monovalent cation/H+ antiporter complex subunit F [Wolbachia endosymbiont of Pentidionis agamae]|uniref:monovalent cation/H+ antiporter complex subunit F n=1 Tax=Wolbachia endosymbiont of Pentidionis agamae TaxID=3110435 RepID=UPI002FCFEC8A